jgi:OHCU decarboxylase
MASLRATDVDRLAWLNALGAEQAEAELLTCCGARAWARSMAACRPFPDRQSLLDRAGAVWRGLSRDDWLEAFRAHPRIGERLNAARGDVRVARWSETEQSGALGATADVAAELAAANRAYEERFGHVFLISATGKSAEEMLAALHERLHNDPDTELRVAASEQAKITRSRLEKLLDP